MSEKPKRQDIKEGMNFLKTFIIDEVFMKVFPDFTSHTLAQKKDLYQTMENVLITHFQYVESLLEQKTLLELHNDLNYIEFREGMISTLFNEVKLGENFKFLSNHVNEAVKQHPGIVRVMRAQADPDEKEKTDFGLSSSDSRVYAFFDGKGFDTYQDLIFDGKHQFITMIEDGHQTRFMKEDLVLDSRFPIVNMEVAAFTNRMINHFQTTKMSDLSQALESELEDDEYER